MTEHGALSRRELLTRTAATTALLATGNFAHAQGSSVLKVGLVGCGGRGNGAVRDHLAADPHAEVTALGDVFPERAEGTRSGLQNDMSL